MKIAVASDHAGFPIKGDIVEFIRSLGHEVEDCGCYSTDSCNYVDYGYETAKRVAAGEFDRGVLICGTGIGIGLAANKVANIRCATCSESASARLTRAHNDANMISFGSRIVGLEVAKDMLSTFLSTEFMGMQHAARIEKLMEL